MCSLWGSATVRMKNCCQTHRSFDVFIPERDADLSMRLPKPPRKTSYDQVERDVVVKRRAEIVHLTHRRN